MGPSACRDFLQIETVLNLQNMTILRKKVFQDQRLSFKAYTRTIFCKNSSKFLE